MKKLTNTEGELKKSVAYKKKRLAVSILWQSLMAVLISEIKVIFLTTYSNS